MKYLLLLVLALVGWWIWRRVQERAIRPPREPRPVEAMGHCAHCGVYAPVSDMLTDEAGRLYCTGSHRALGPRPGNKA